MFLKLVVPRADTAFEAGVLVKWHVDAGDPIPFGTPVCDISIDEFLALRRTKRASLLGSTKKSRQRRVNDGVYRREGRGAVVVRLVCAESNLTLRRKEVEEGGRIRVGEVAALLGPADEPLPTELPNSEARMSTDFPDAEEFDSFD